MQVKDIATKTGRNDRTEENELAMKVYIREQISEFKALRNNLMSKVLAVKKEVTDLEDQVPVLETGLGERREKQS